MSTKKEVKSVVCICVEVEKLTSLDQKIEVLEVLRNTLSTTKSNYNYYIEDAKCYADQGYEEGSVRSTEKAEAYGYVIKLIEDIASKI